MDENTGVIYLITNIVNNKQYVGQAVSYSGKRPWGSWRRWQTHVKILETTDVNANSR